MGVKKAKKKSRQTRMSRSAQLQPGKILKLKSNVQMPQELKMQGIGPFTVLRKEGAYVILSGRTEFRVSKMKAVKLFEPCQLRIC